MRQGSVRDFESYWQPGQEQNGGLPSSDGEEAFYVPITGGGLPRADSPTHATSTPPSREIHHELPELYVTVGVSGAQGVGKSSLISELLGTAIKHQDLICSWDKKHATIPELSVALGPNGKLCSRDTTSGQKLRLRLQERSADSSVGDDRGCPLVLLCFNGMVADSLEWALQTWQQSSRSAVLSVLVACQPDGVGSEWAVTQEKARAAAHKHGMPYLRRGQGLELLTILARAAVAERHALHTQWCLPFERAGHVGVSAALEASENLAPETQPGQAMRHQVQERVCPSSATPESHAFSQQLLGLRLADETVSGPTPQTEEQRHAEAKSTEREAVTTYRDLKPIVPVLVLRKAQAPDNRTQAQQIKRANSASPRSTAPSPPANLTSPSVKPPSPPPPAVPPPTADSTTRAPQPAPAPAPPLPTPTRALALPSPAPCGGSSRRLVSVSGVPVHRRRHSVTVVEVKYAGGGGFVPFVRDKHTHRRLLGQVPVTLSGGMASLIDVHEFDSPQHLLHEFRASCSGYSLSKAEGERVHDAITQCLRQDLEQDPPLSTRGRV